ncbi:tRNA pseudouridine32 synthase/23S rRNA pseudouridine746 synthase [Wenyingzhuangia heitensis]|uniref:tRNA pseudouridine32 synthase/23S rRNA pseudouridine746 synthase n=1 Tax=Wenyingzhuangia heitensis TaxID=1487859 RepID=A0ABX0UB01_9FLAO|nr:pseudouridine synthase [Wenyingzhuangia heitensis]NIJ44636.1 tRNA pseudouridine32 synthase/23S rRNA pseudouridine746 synthase [Wenyingzhuangia heitensis]
MSALHFFHSFNSDISNIALPKKFTYPFYYETHPLCELAAKQVQDYITHQQEWQHPFTENNLLNEKPIGKMFGVLVVKNQKGDIGFISAFSGKLAGTNNHSYFVPPVFDMLSKNSHFLKEEIALNNINAQIEALENNTDYILYKNKLEQTLKKSIKEIGELRAFMIKAKKERKEERLQAEQTLSTNDYQILLEKLAKKSVAAKTKLKKLTLSFEEKIKELQNQVATFKHKIQDLKTLRKEKSNALQHYLFHQYKFLNQKGEEQDLLDIFKQGVFETPPAGAGECAAPKLLQYAFINKLTPICMAEFWWGDSPKSEIRKHGNYYPACQGKCKPILGHMLDGMEMDENPLLTNPAIGKEITTVFEDDYLVVVNKPAEFLSVPGKTIHDSVYLRMKQKFPNATGPLIVHRLDMSTSGLMVIAKTKEIHQHIQRQFIKRQVNKRYVALLDGIPEKEEGFIDLPLRLDIDDRPRQLVCFEHGKSARTKWEIIDKKNGKTKVYFYPVTGRTHQLRVHASHQLGLNTAIVGDDLYGKKQNRLHLHAESITFRHPITQKEITVQIEADF